MAETFSGFDWDAGNRAKCQKHGVTIPEIEALFSEPLLIVPDATHSKSETRIRALGSTSAGRMIFWCLRFGSRAVGEWSGRSARDICMRKRLLLMKKKIPSFKSDAAAERFISRADLTRYDLSGLKPVRFEFEKKSSQLNMRLPKPLLDAVKRRAKERGIPYTRFLRELIEQGISMPLR